MTIEWFVNEANKQGASQKLRPSGCLENQDPKNSDPVDVSKLRPEKYNKSVFAFKTSCLPFLDMMLT